MDFKGTKSEWVTDQKEYEFSKGNQTIEVWTDGDGSLEDSKWICQVNAICIKDKEIETVKANARLIAAAPDLLKELQFSLKILERDKDPIFSKRLAITNAKHAIKKALEGKKEEKASTPEPSN